jgi:hypothetical protein
MWQVCCIYILQDLDKGGNIMKSKCFNRIPLILIFTFVITVTLWSNVMAKSLFVSTSGSDSVDYTTNDISHPWLTVAKAWSAAQSGDTVYFRAGTYAISSKISGPGASNINFKPYTGEFVTWSSSVTDSVFEVTKTSISVDGFSIIWLPGAGTDMSEAGFFRIGYDSSATGFTLKNCAISGNWCGDNVGVIHIRAIRGNNLDVENCSFTRTADTSCTHQGNTASIVVMYANGVTIKNNTFSGGQAIYYKYGNTTSPGPNIENNYFYHCVSGGGYNRGLHTLSYAGTFKNNIFNACGDVMVGDSYQSAPNGTNNTFDHNTFFNTQLVYSRTDATGNKLTNNIIMSGYFLELADGPSITSFSSNNNLFPATATAVRGPNYTQYTLSTWKTAAGSDANSIAGAPTFSGGSTPTTIAGFALTPGSKGDGAASDGLDMGADTSKVGSGVTISSDSSAPATPSGVKAVIIQ